LNPNVVVLPNCVNEDDWDEPLRNEGDKVRVGIVGSTAYAHDFDRIKDVLTKLDADPRVQLVLMGLKKRDSKNPLIAKTYDKEYDFWESLPNLEHMEWCPMEEYFDALNELRFDMMLIPRRENNFNRAKSNVKFLEASMLEIPVIAQSFEDGPYQEITDGLNGFLIKDDSEWLSKIDRLINDKDLRRTVGRKAREYVLTNYNIKDKFVLWKQTYENITNN
jgi:glycosyltransferase involved in cell wall biosynthesis